MFEMMRDLFQILHDARRRRGSIDFDLNEAEVVIDEGGIVEAIIALSATWPIASSKNSCCWPTRRSPQPSTPRALRPSIRVHEPPDAREGGEIRGLHRRIRLRPRRAADVARPRHFQKLIERIHGKPEEKPIAFLMLRTMQKARYDPENLGHFGLAASSYTHFTSPIRRYPDLVVHRALRAARRDTLEPPRRARNRSRICQRSPATRRKWAARRRSRARAPPVEESEVHGRQGRRQSSTDMSRALSAFGLFIELIEHFVEGPRACVDDGGRLLSVRRERAHAARGEHTRRSTGSATG